MAKTCFVQQTYLPLELLPISEERSYLNRKNINNLLPLCINDQKCRKCVKYFLWLCHKKKDILELYLLWQYIASLTCTQQLASDRKGHFKQNTFVCLLNLALWTLSRKRFLENVMIISLNFWKSIRTARYSWRSLC